MEQTLQSYLQYLREQEKQPATIQKYARDIRRFLDYLRLAENQDRPLDKELVLDYKEHLLKSCKVSSVNSMLVALNGFFRFAGLDADRVKVCRVQQEPFCARERELTRQEYFRLVREAGRTGNCKLEMILQCIASTGMRISELRFLTVEALQRGCMIVRCKGKVRTVLMPRSLIKKLRDYCRKAKIKKGSIFVTKSGRPLDRSNIWRELKSLCAGARVAKAKVFPHNLRHLFARAFYQAEKDIVRLADILGHSSIDTTRIYTAQSAGTYEKIIRKLGLVVEEMEPESGLTENSLATT